VLLEKVFTPFRAEAYLSDVAWSKFLISIIWTRVNCKKLMPCKYFTVLVHAYLKIAATKVKTFTNMALKSAS
jgi:hypothetical protein